MKKIIIYLAVIFSTVSCELITTIVQDSTGGYWDFSEATQFKIEENVKPGVDACYLDNMYALFLVEGPSLADIRRSIIYECDIDQEEEYTKVLVWTKLNNDATYSYDMKYIFFDDEDRVAFVLDLLDYNYFDNVLVYTNYSGGQCDLFSLYDEEQGDIRIKVSENINKPSSGVKGDFIRLLTNLDAVMSVTPTTMIDETFTKSIKSAKNIISRSGDATKLDEHMLQFFEKATERLHEDCSFKDRLSRAFHELRHYFRDYFGHSYFVDKYGDISIQIDQSEKLTDGSIRLTYRVQDVKYTNSGLVRTIFWINENDHDDYGEVTYTDNVTNKEYRDTIKVSNKSATYRFYIAVYPKDMFFPVMFCTR